MSGKPGRSGVYKHNYASEETIEKCRKAYYRWSKKPDPQKLKEPLSQGAPLDNSL